MPAFIAKPNSQIIGWALVVLVVFSGLTSFVNGDTPLQQRLERICDQLHKQAAASHVPGFAIAIVKDDQVILNRGFGVRDTENNEPVTDETLFAIGSTTKAFTATLIGMLTDERKMNWDDPVRKHLPEFHLSDAAADEQIVIRDLLCHRAGLANNDLLWYSGASTREQILRTVAGAQLLHPFRKKFNYNNVMFLAAGEAAGRAAGSDWDTLIQQRIFAPLGMTNSNTSVKVARTSPRLSKGYVWDKDKSEFVHKPMRDLDNIAPAGSINSCSRDMAQWVRLLLNKGVIGEQKLVNSKTIDETWTSQIEMSGDVAYGLGWMLNEWNGRRVVQHSGGIDGFGAHVALLPDDRVGFAILTNVTVSPLQAMSVNIVFDNLVGQIREDEAALDPASVEPYLGKYQFDVLNTDVTVLMQNGRLAIDVPGQMVYELKPPDEQGKWVFALTDQIAASFVRDDKDEVIGMKMYQAGLVFELPKEGHAPPVEVSPAEGAKYAGVYRGEEPARMDVTVLVKNGRLAVDVPGQMVYALHLPDEEGKWVFRATADIAVRFNTDDSGAVVSMTHFQNGREHTLKRIESGGGAEDLPALEQVIALQSKGHGAANLSAIKNIRMTGTLHFVHQGARGNIHVTAAGLDRFVQVMDLGEFGYIASALDGDRAWSDSSFGEFEELTGNLHHQTRLLHPLVIAADWRDFFEAIEVEQAASLDGRKAYGLSLRLNKDVTCTSFVDAESGLVLKDELMIRHRGAGPIKTTITYDEYRDVEGVKLPVRYSVANDINGKMTVQIDRIETNIELPAEVFTLKPRAR